MTKIFKFLLLLLPLLLVVSCGKDGALEEPEMPESFDPNLHIDLKAKVGTAKSLIVGDTFIEGGVHNYTISVATFFLSDFVLIKQDGSTVPFHDVSLIDFGETHGSNGEGVNRLSFEVASGVYRGMKFNFGLNPDQNAMNPTMETAPIALQQSGMYWGWATGYRFLKFEGLYDTTVLSSSAINEPFVFHVGTSTLSYEVDFDNDFYTIPESGSKVYEIEVDLAKVFNGVSTVNLYNENFTHTLGDSTKFNLAQKVAVNFSNAFQHLP